MSEREKATAESELEGGCLCGAIRYRLHLEPLDAGYCHCRLCQRASGAPVLAWLTAPLRGFSYTKGRPAVYRSSDHAQREFCGSCGTHIAFRRTNAPKTVDVTLASLSDPSRITPQYHIWLQSKIRWLETGDSLPRHDGSGPDNC